MNAQRKLEHIEERRELPRPDPKHEMYPRLITITPEMAERFLQLNTRNRKVKELTVRKIIRDWEENGPGEPTHQGVAFYASDGALADGQNRLVACVRAGVSFRSWVFWGLSEDAAVNIDRHRPRSEADAIKISGVSDWMDHQGIAITKMILDAHGFDPATFSVPSLVQVGEKIAGPVQFAMMVFDGRKRKHLTASPIMAAVAIASEHVDEMRLYEFVNVLISGMPQSEADIAAIKLRDQLMEKESRGGRAARQEVLLRTMRAIKAFVAGERLRRLTTPSTMIYRLTALDR